MHQERRWPGKANGALAFVCVLGLSASAEAGVIDQPHQPARKLSRGVANLFTGVLELPLAMNDISARKGPVAGLTLGSLVGIGAAARRIVVGLVEITTFPFPLRGIGYEPILLPEFFFEDWAEAKRANEQHQQSSQ